MTNETGAIQRAEPTERQELGWRRSGERAGFSVASAAAAFVGGFFLVPLVAFATFSVPGALLFVSPVLISLGFAFWLARRSRISFAWLAWPLLGALAAGAVGFVAWFAATWEPMD
jgi:hypothetical protein